MITANLFAFATLSADHDQLVHLYYIFSKEIKMRKTSIFRTLIHMRFVWSYVWYHFLFGTKHIKWSLDCTNRHFACKKCGMNAKVVDDSSVVFLVCTCSFTQKGKIFTGYHSNYGNSLLV